MKHLTHVAPMACVSVAKSKRNVLLERAIDGVMRPFICNEKRTVELLQMLVQIRKPAE